MKPPIKNFSAFTYPKGNVVNWFGDDVELYKSVIGTNGHNGIDIVAPWGTPIQCVESGTVNWVKTEAESIGGNEIGIQADSGGWWIYCHLAKIEVKMGQRIEAGEQIGLMGNTGFVISGPTPYWEFNPYAGTHLHLGYTPPDSNRNNGFNGYIDFREELENCDPNMREYKVKQLTVISLLNQLAELLKVALLQKK